MSGPSAWWPVPADVGRWYDDETRAAARRYHRPAEIADGLALAAQAIGLVVVVVAARGSADRWTVAIAVVAVAVAPPLAVEVWREYVHRPRFGERPVPPAGFVLAAVGRGLAAGFVVVGLTVAVEWAVAPTVAASVATVVAVHGVGSAVGGRVTLATHRVVPADPALTEEVVAVADILGLDPPDVRVVGAVDADRFEPNAFVVGRFGRARVVAVTPALAEGPADVRRFVIAHELGHVRRHHLLARRCWSRSWCGGRRWRSGWLLPIGGRPRWPRSWLLPPQRSGPARSWLLLPLHGGAVPSNGSPTVTRRGRVTSKRDRLPVFIGSARAHSSRPG